MLMDPLYFWDSTYNYSHLSCEMITPTFFDVASITGLPPTRETFDPYQQEENTIDFKVKNVAFTKYISLYHAQGDEVSDVEHIAFLARWLSRCIFWYKSLQVSKRFLTVANQLHSGRRICLSELTLTGLYESLKSATSKLKGYN